MKKICSVVAILVCSFASGAFAQTATYIEGTHYTKLHQPISTYSGKAKEVAALFGYGCQVCAVVETKLQKLERALPAGVTLERVPVNLGNHINTLAQAKAFFVMQALNKEDQMHAAMFHEIAVKRKKLNTEPELQTFFFQHGVDNAKYQQISQSFGVSGQQNKAQKFVQQSNSVAVPDVIVNGKYRVMINGLNNLQDLDGVVNHLLSK